MATPNHHNWFSKIPLYPIIFKSYIDLSNLKSLKSPNLEISNFKCPNLKSLKSLNPSIPQS